MWKFKDGEQQNIEKFLAGLQSLYGVIPQLKAMKIGVNCGKDSNYDAVLESEFDSLEDLEKYKAHPKHIIVSTLCQSIRLYRCAVDYEI